ncbi:hypothetical protein ABPG74_002758 [Tetrahymena malaccensis]
MKLVSILLVFAIFQIVSIQGDQSCGVDKNAIEQYCPSDYSCCGQSQCCSSTEFCSNESCISILLVVFGPLSLILFLVAICVNWNMDKKEKFYRKQLQELSEQDAQILLPNQDYQNDEDDLSQNAAPEIIQQQPENMIINDDQTALPFSQPIKQKNKKEININSNEETIDYQLNTPFLNKQDDNDEEQEEQKENNNRGYVNDDQQTIQQQNYNFNKNNNNLQDEDKTYSVFKKND